MGTNYRAVFKYTGIDNYMEAVVPLVKAAMQMHFFDVWNDMAEGSEERYKKWNAEYGEIISQDDYEKFIATKIQAYLDEQVNGKMAWPLMKFKADTVDAGNLIGYLADHPDVTITMYLKPV